MKILILGGRGRLAAALAKVWGPAHEVSCLSRPELDVADLSAMEKLLAGATFDVLVNGTGMTNVDECETRHDEARTVNALAPASMAAAATRKGARFIHFSTDYVMDGLKISPYSEEDAAHPLGWYGQTKLDGESAVLTDAPSHLVVRVCWVFGPDKPSFVDMILERARTNPRVEAVADKFSSPTYAPDVAGWLEPFFDPALPGGLYHACNTGGCSWRDYGAYAIQCAAEAGLPLATTVVEPVRLKDMKAFKAPRPVHTILSTEKLTRVTGIVPRPWQDAVRDYIQKKYAPLPPAR
ncbi:MAG: dTDP-4-dehydrorhamnose reductase [Verrucomicrobia bacterium]|nr:dTDP-4-dehydrorhamnose reductase [Verrucomicrobiota bacterium]